MKKLIKLHDKHYVIIDESLPIEEGKQFLTQENIIHTIYGWNFGDRVITHSTLPLDNTEHIELEYIKDLLEDNYGLFNLYNKNKLFTIEDMSKLANYAIQLGINTNIAHRNKANGLPYEIPNSDNLIEKFIFELIPEIELDIEIVNNKIKLL